MFLTFLLALGHWLCVYLLGIPDRHKVPYLFAILTFWSAFSAICQR